MGKPMGYFLIVLGIIAIVGGIVLITRQVPDDSVDSEDITYFAQPAPAAPAAPLPAEPQPSAAPAADNQARQKAEPKPAAAAVEDYAHTTGGAFEDFVVNLLADWRLKLLDRTQDAVSSAGVVAESCKNPDLHVQQRRGKSNIDYYLECKYRSHWDGGKVTFEDWQVKRYRQFQYDNRRKVVIALGVGGKPSAPSTFMLVPLDSLKGYSIRRIDTEFVVEPTSSNLVEYMDNYFSNVFAATRSRKKAKAAE